MYFSETNNQMPNFEINSGAKTILEKRKHEKMCFVFISRSMGQVLYNYLIQIYPDLACL